MDDSLKDSLDFLNQKLSILIEDCTTAQKSIKHIIDRHQNYAQKIESKNELLNQKSAQNDLIKLNIGGRIFSTLKSTLTKKIRDNHGSLYPSNIFEKMLNYGENIKFDENGVLFIDRSPEYFNYILEYLRDFDTEIEFKLPKDIDLNKLNQEAQFYNLKGLEEMSEILEPASMESNILNERQIKDLYELCEFSKKTKWNLLYRATRDGFKVGDFHKKCDNIPHTLTIIKTDKDYIFGGYTEKSWDESTSCKHDKNAFLFSLVNYRNSREKIKVWKEDLAIYCGLYGPCFGENDITICNESNIKDLSYSNLGNSYRSETGDPHLMTGHYNFKTAEIEVFQKI
ncbi:unnamed protein product [Brachionus calyciflorus]|uniref:TLDc domain-containing protein n=1 Tax=Brachionus calyciflorus TaxID=104777 RepID=A0A813M6H9_9BILA|nr:unnamed protein product [Brachionus calyciflorus]